jgi:hypothetical protein
VTAVARLNSYSRHYSAFGVSGAVSAESSKSLKLAIESLDNSVTRGLAKGTVLSRILEASSEARSEGWDADGAHAVSPTTAEAAIQLLFTLPTDLPPPEVSPEATGEISFEWYRDRQRLFMLTVQDNVIRWAGFLGAGSRISGSGPFGGSVPVFAIDSIRRLYE